MEKLKFDLVFQVALCVSDLDAILENWKKYVDFDETTLVRRSTNCLLYTSPSPRDS